MLCIVYVYVWRCPNFNFLVSCYLHVGPPSEPKKPTVSGITRTSARVRWAPPDHDGRSQILSYQVEMLQAGFTTWQAIIQQPRSSFTIRTLEPGTSYQFRVIAYNKYGASKPSEPCEPIVTRARGWLNQPTKRSQANNLPNINIDGPTGEDTITVYNYRNVPIGGSYEVPICTCTM